MYDDVEYSTTVGLRIRLLMYNIKNLHDVYLKSRYHIVMNHMLY